MSRQSNTAQKRAKQRQEKPPPQQLQQQQQEEQEKEVETTRCQDRRIMLYQRPQFPLHRLCFRVEIRCERVKFCCELA